MQYSPEGILFAHAVHAQSYARHQLGLKQTVLQTELHTNSAGKACQAKTSRQQTCETTLVELLDCRQTYSHRPNNADSLVLHTSWCNCTAQAERDAQNVAAGTCTHEGSV
jgi:hypothetical protein